MGNFKHRYNDIMKKKVFNISKKKEADWVWLAKVANEESVCWNRNLSRTFGDFCNVGICDSDVGDPLQVGESTFVDSCAVQRVGAELWENKRQNIRKWSPTQNQFPRWPLTRTQRWVMGKHSLWQGNGPELHADFLRTTLPGLSQIIILISSHFPSPNAHIRHDNRICVTRSLEMNHRSKSERMGMENRGASTCFQV